MRYNFNSLQFTQFIDFRVTNIAAPISTINKRFFFESSRDTKTHTIYILEARTEWESEAALSHPSKSYLNE